MGNQLTILIAGCGYTGIRTGIRWRDTGADVYGLVRTAESQSALKNAGINPMICDLDADDTFPDFPAKDAIVYYFVPPPKSQTDSRLGHFLRSLPADNLPGKIIYISTTGVYGNTNGEWVTEDSPINPETGRAKRRVDAENYLLDWVSSNSVDYVILRVAGIYGPDRIPVEKIRRKKPVLLMNEAPFSNRIHVDDLAEICVQAGRQDVQNTIYNVSDGNPGIATEFYYILADMLGIGRPPAISLDEARRTMSAMRLSFLEESRRVDSSKMKRELQVQLNYPDVQSGLLASLQSMGVTIK